MQENKIKAQNKEEPSAPYIKEIIDFNLESNRNDSALKGFEHGTLVSKDDEYVITYDSKEEEDLEN